MTDARPLNPVIPYLFYKDASAAYDWLARAFGFIGHERVAAPRGLHCEMIAEGSLIMFSGNCEELGFAAPSPSSTQGVFIYLADDIDAHYQRALAAGAKIPEPPQDLPYGRSYTAYDPEGHPWFFTQRA